MEGSTWMVTVTVIYILAMVILSWYVGKKMTNTETEFMIGGREFTPFMTAVGNSSILISGGYLPGIIMYGYMFGMGGMWFYLGWGTGALVALLFWAGFWRTTGAVTPTEWFEYRYGKGGRMAITIVVLAASLAIIGWQYVGSGAIIAGALGITPKAAIALVGIVVTLYVALGGIWAATITDVIQFVWVALAVFVILPIWLIVNHGMPDAALLPANFLSVPFGSIPIVQFVVPSVLTFLLMHQSLLNQAPYWARSAGTRNLEVVKKGWIWTVVIAYTTGVIGAFMGCYVRMLVPNLEAPSLALGSLLAIIPVPLAAVVMAGLMAATMSTCDIYLVSSVNQLVRDIAQNVLKIRDTDRLLAWAKWGTIIFGVATVIFAMYWARGLGLLFAFGTGIGAPLFIFYLDSWLMKVGNGKGAIAAVIASLGTVLYWEILTDHYVAVHTLWLVFPITFVTLVVVSLLTREEEEAIPEGWEASELGKLILVTIRKGYTDAASIIDRMGHYCLVNDLQAAEIHNELDTLERAGLVNREAPRLIKQLYFNITPEGEKAIAGILSEEDVKLLESQNIDSVELRVLQALKSGPAVLNKLAESLQIYNIELNAIVNRLAEVNLIKLAGQGRITMEITEQGDNVIKSLAS
ncbi:MAG TPA: sodium:solute symporter family protein [Syntrophomonadaceae bacterium]|nr:sodium:solute symporter family protein [Syntrophomonadaceae bacterium]